jgi:hypothetical protein
MAQAYTDDELLGQARTRAFEGMVIVAMLADKSDDSLFPTLRDHFSAILTAIERSGT